MIAHLVFREVVGEAADEDLVIAVGDRARHDAQRRQVQLGNRPQTGDEHDDANIQSPGGNFGDMFNETVA